MKSTKNTVYKFTRRILKTTNRYMFLYLYCISCFCIVFVMKHRAAASIHRWKFKNEILIIERTFVSFLHSNVIIMSENEFCKLISNLVNILSYLKLEICLCCYNHLSYAPVCTPCFWNDRTCEGRFDEVLIIVSWRWR